MVIGVCPIRREDSTRRKERVVGAGCETKIANDYSGEPRDRRLVKSECCPSQFAESEKRAEYIGPVAGVKAVSS
jgi:hypothetical protein